MHPRTRKALDRLPPETRAAAEAMIARDAARRATPEGRAAEAEVIRQVMEEVPPATIDPALRDALAALKAERERSGSSLADVAARSRLDRAMVHRLESGKIVNPTVATLRAYAAALGKRWTWAVADAGAPAGSR
jgi:ribosome-binding protein aMBF1 (putative translation factor)